MAQAPDVGSHVRLKLTTHDGDTMIEGVVLPPAVAEHVTVKLANGYNISHPIASIEILSRNNQPPLSRLNLTLQQRTQICLRFVLSTLEGPSLQRSTTQPAL